MGPSPIYFLLLKEKNVYLMCICGYMKDFELLKMDPFHSLDWVFRLILSSFFYSFRLTAEKSPTVEPVPLAMQLVFLQQ